MGPLFQDAWREIADNPSRYIAEVVQAMLLIGIIWWFGRGNVRRRLEERRKRIETDLAEADGAERACQELDAAARAAAARGASEAPEIVRAAGEKAVRDRDGLLAAADADAARLVEEATRTVQSEKERVGQEASERLTRLTTELTRRYVDEMLSEADRRALTHQAIQAVLEQLKATPVTDRAGAA